jgi:putative tricarboxylic transport membrane protein
VKGGITVAGAALAALGALSLLEAFRLKDDWLGAKLMPAVVGVLLVLLGAAHAALPAERAPWPEATGARRVPLMLTVLAAYVGLLPVLGFLPATALFVFVVVRALGEYSWALTATWTGVIAVASHVVFKHWLGMALPAGPLGF